MSTVPPDSIVVGIDGSPSSDAALDWAVREALRLGRPLHLLHARGLDNWWYAAGSPTPDEVDEKLHDDMLSRRLEQVRSVAPDVDVTSEASTDNAAPALVRESERAHSLVLGARGHGAVRGALLGSVSSQVTAHARCPVVVLRAPLSELSAQGPVVVGVDGSRVSEAAVDYAFRRAAASDAELVAVHAWWVDQDGDQRWLAPFPRQQAEFVESKHRLAAEALEPWRASYPNVRVRGEVVRRHPVDALVHASMNAQMLVVGSRGRGGFRGLLLGSVSLRSLQHAHCPVAVVRPGTDREHLADTADPA
ncbi:MAG TPA: universal stress protein [Segeticoccus sp.]|nr:universal stress protein [Segeticoccus sp.]